MRDVEIPNWLKGLPLAPEFHPTDTEFADPIAYISKIEKEASAFGICKVIPPYAKPSKKYVFTNLNNSLLKCPELGSNVNLSKVHNGDKVNTRAMFTTRHQELGQSGKRTKGAVNNPQLPIVHKKVWQTGEVYTVEQFETKSKSFTKTHLGMVKDVCPIVIETLFWQAASEKPIYIEYANDVPGSAFAQPDGSLRKFHRRIRRRRTFRRTDSNDLQPDTDNANSNPDTVRAMTCSPNMSLNQQPCRQSNLNEMERNSSGWKLSNSAWNLQVIARAPGSLTRFMPDDIPGVTSPMVYMGMLFSWFAWHVEDHELHSLNFLHTGSQKTWYAVPGDYAFTFEETIRKKAYGDNIDKLAALTLLGEKTTLLSPEVIVASDIPCCRLVQNPGEFVVTFPRAYHVGFSHGFNCGEAANFGTPKWLSVAKEAAVRRAAMNYLPMLSHQQLLYLLTMSFISRVPRALLPGVRSSRLRDRQKEEREMLVKKAFIEDLINENDLLRVLLRKNPTYHTVLWDLESLQSSIKEFDMCSSIARMETTPLLPKDYCGGKEENLYSEISKYMESGNNWYLEEDDSDLSYSFQVDTGTLPCVACGVLGFPFMAIVQPSSKDLFISPPKLTTCNEYLRPHIFCLEHAIQIEELLQSKGGANVLLICHSDFQKIKTHVALVAEEIGRKLNYKEIRLDEGSKEELKLISVAIENEEKDDEEDWTSELNINMRHRAKLSKLGHHPLTLCGLFSNPGPSTLDWKSKSTRSKRRLNPLSHDNELSQIIPSPQKLNLSKQKEDKKIIQYSRRIKHQKDKIRPETLTA